MLAWLSSWHELGACTTLECALPLQLRKKIREGTTMAMLKRWDCNAGLDL